MQGCRFCLGTVPLGVCRLVLSLLGYFFYVSTAFTAIMVLLISLFNNSKLERVRHYPRPIIVEHDSLERAPGQAQEPSAEVASAGVCEVIVHTNGDAVLGAAIAARYCFLWGAVVTGLQLNIQINTNVHSVVKHSFR
jgi:hypothetical protein